MRDDGLQRKRDLARWWNRGSYRPEPRYRPLRERLLGGEKRGTDRSRTVASSGPFSEVIVETELRDTRIKEEPKETRNNRRKEQREKKAAVCVCGSVREKRERENESVKAGLMDGVITGSSKKVSDSSYNIVICYGSD